MSDTSVRDFQETVWQRARDLYRPMPWRDDTRPYYILVSELMLQQTQVERVIPKFNDFITRFPTVQALARASLSEVLVLWSGLGYNRRARFLHEAAHMIVNDFAGTIPDTAAALMTLPGVGVNTAGAILVYGFDQPAIFIETNVRTVYFEHFFQDDARVTDAQLRPLIERTIDREHPRQWYWAIMDYGTTLKKTGRGRLDKSHHYKKQSPLKGSVREIRGLIIKVLTVEDATIDQLRQRVPQDERFGRALESLQADQLVDRTADRFHLRR